MWLAGGIGVCCGHCTYPCGKEQENEGKPGWERHGWGMGYINKEHSKGPYTARPIVAEGVRILFS